MQLVFAQTIVLAHPQLWHHTEIPSVRWLPSPPFWQKGGEVLKAPCFHVAWKNKTTQHSSPVWTIWLWIRPWSCCKPIWLWHLMGQGDSPAEGSGTLSPVSVPNRLRFSGYLESHSWSVSSRAEISFIRHHIYLCHHQFMNHKSQKMHI